MCHWRLTIFGFWNVPSEVLPIGSPAVVPFESVTQRLMAVRVGKPQALITYASPTPVSFGAMLQPEPAP